MSDLHVNFEPDVNKKVQRVEFDEPQQFALTTATHVSVRGAVTINGVACNHSTHLHRRSDGEWILRCDAEGKTNHERFQDIYLSRQGSIDDPSFAAKKAAYQCIPIILSGVLTKLADIEEKRLLAHQRDVDRRRQNAIDEQTKAAEALRVATELLDGLNDVASQANEGVMPAEYHFETKD